MPLVMLTAGDFDLRQLAQYANLLLDRCLQYEDSAAGRYEVYAQLMHLFVVMGKVEVFLNFDLPVTQLYIERYAKWIGGVGGSVAGFFEHNVTHLQNALSYLQM